VRRARACHQPLMPWATEKERRQGEGKRGSGREGKRKRRRTGNRGGIKGEEREGKRQERWLRKWRK
jgi:hypothetical protein